MQGTLLAGAGVLSSACSEYNDCCRVVLVNAHVSTAYCVD